MSDEADSRRAIRELVESWVVWRDAGEWERLRTVWHDDGRMMATWFQGTRRRLHRGQRAGLGARRPHPPFPRRHLDRSRRRPRRRPDEDDDLAARRGARYLCDVVCTGRFYDFFERRDGRWGLVLRQPIYEKDRLDPVDPARSWRSTPACSKASRRATVTSPISRPRWGTPSRTTCPGSTGPRSSRSTRAARAGSRAARRTEPHDAGSDRRGFALGVAGGVLSSAPGGTISTARWACWATPCETEPSSIDLNADSPRAPRTTRHASCRSAASRIDVRVPSNVTWLTSAFASSPAAAAARRRRRDLQCRFPSSSSE